MHHANSVNKPPCYYLSVHRNHEKIIDKRPFDDFAQAIAACQAYYTLRMEHNSPLKFNTEVVRGEFAQSYAELIVPAEVEDPESHPGAARYHTAVKQANAFIYDANYLFMIQSELGVQLHQAWLED